MIGLWENRLKNIDQIRLELTIKCQFFFEIFVRLAWCKVGSLMNRIQSFERKVVSTQPIF